MGLLFFIFEPLPSRCVNAAARDLKLAFKQKKMEEE